MLPLKLAKLLKTLSKNQSKLQTFKNFHELWVFCIMSVCPIHFCQLVNLRNLRKKITAIDFDPTSPLWVLPFYAYGVFNELSYCTILFDPWWTWPPMHLSSSKRLPLNYSLFSHYLNMKCWIQKAVLGIWLHWYNLSHFSGLW